MAEDDSQSGNSSSSTGGGPASSSGTPATGGQPAARRGRSANVPQRRQPTAAPKKPAAEKPATQGVSRAPGKPPATPPTPATPGGVAATLAGKALGAAGKKVTTKTTKTVTTSTTSGDDGVVDSAAPAARPEVAGGRKGGSQLLASRGSGPGKQLSSAVSKATGGAGSPLLRSGASASDPASTGGTESGYSSAPTTSDQAKDFAKKAVTEAAKGAVTGGAAGAGRGLLIAIWQSPLARTVAIGTILAIILAPVFVVLGIVLMASTSSGGGPDNDVAVEAATSAGVSADEAREAMAAVDGTDVPWTIYAAYKQATGKPLDVKAFVAALRKADKSKRYWDLFAGTVTDAKNGFEVSKDSNDSAIAKKVRDTYVAAFTAYGVDASQAGSIFDQALKWSLGQGQQVCQAAGSAGTVPIDQTGPPVYNLPAEASYGATLATLTPTQVNNARAVMSAVKLVFAGVPDQLQQRAAVIALVTAMQEAKFENLPTSSSDLDSAGMFQQRPHYGSEADRMRADLSSYWFLIRLAGVENWATLPAAEAAQTVQVSAFPDAYAKWEAPIAQPLVKQYWSTVTAMPVPAGQNPPPGVSVPGGVVPGVNASCSTGTGALAPGDPGDVGGGGGFAPNQAQVEQAIAFASQQLGKPYVSPGDSVNTWDCSGLTLAAYGAAGINLNGHLVSIQYNLMKAQGRLQPLKDARRGDLVFWSSNGRDDAEFIHVAIYLGKDSAGNTKILAAPKPGDVVKIQNLWTSSDTVLMNMVGRPSGLPS